MFLMPANCKKTPHTELVVGNSIGQGKVTQEKPCIASTTYAAGHCIGKTKCSLRMKQAAILHSVERVSDIDLFFVPRDIDQTF